MSNKKSQLNLYCQKARVSTPSYATEKKGDMFVSQVTVNEATYTSIQGHTTKKEAEGDAAGVALQDFVHLHPKAKSVEELLKIVDNEMNSRHKKQLTRLPAEVSTGGPQFVPARSVMQTQSPPMPIPCLQSALQVGQVSNRPVIYPSEINRQPMMVPMPRIPIRSNSPAPHPRPVLPASVSVPISISPRTGTVAVGMIRSQSPSQANYGPMGVSPPRSSFPFAQTNYGVMGMSPPRSSFSLAQANYGVMGVSPPQASHPFAQANYSVMGVSPPQSSLSLGQTNYNAIHQLYGAMCVSSTQSPLPHTQPNFPPIGAHMTALPSSHTRPNIMAMSTALSSNPPAPLSVPSPSPSHHIMNPHSITYCDQGTPRGPSIGNSLRWTSSGSSGNSLPVRPVLQAQSTHSHSNFELALEKYCHKHKISPPQYKINEADKRYTAKVIVNGQEYEGKRDYETFEIAKENVTLIALACIGLEALNMENKEPPTGYLGSRPIYQETDSIQARNSWSSQHPPVILQRTIKTEASSALQVSPYQTPVQSSPAVTQEEVPATIPLPPAFFIKGRVAVSSPLVQLPSTTATFASPATAQPVAINTESSSIVPAKKKDMANHKLALQTFCQKNKYPLPHYECSYPEDEVGYIATLKVQDKVFVSTPHGTKRGAESAAAAMALRSYGETVESGDDQIKNGNVEHGSLEVPTTINASERPVSYKNLLQEYLQKSRITDLPRYETERTDKGFISTVSVRLSPDNTQHFEGSVHYSNKKAAEQECAKVACIKLKLVA